MARYEAQEACGAGQEGRCLRDLASIHGYACRSRAPLASGRRFACVFRVSGASIEFVFKKPALDRTVVKLYFPFGFESDSFSERLVSRENIAPVAWATLFEEIADFLVSRFEESFLAESFAVFGVEYDDSGFFGDWGFFEVADSKFD